MQKTSTGIQPGNKFILNGSASNKLRGLGASAVKSRLLEDTAQQQGVTATGWKNAGGDVSYRDAVLPIAQRRITRQQLDKKLIDNVVTPDHTYLRKVVPLSRCCLRLITENIGSEIIQEQLAYRLLPEDSFESLCSRVRKAFKGQELPLSVWKTLTACANELPSAFKTYTGIVFDDLDELKNMNTFNNITLLDLSNTAFQATDIYKIRMYFSNSLVALKLDHVVSIQDDTITALARDVGTQEGQYFAKLEILTLKGCKLITDKSAPKLAKFSALKMLDLRGTSCTSATKDLLRRLTKPPYVPAFTPIHLALFGPQRLDDTFRAFSRTSGMPFVKTLDDLPRVAESDNPACILVSELSRLDEAKVLDPSLPVVRNKFVSSHHIYGNVYTTMPISAASLVESGMEESSKGAAFRVGNHASVMSGQLSNAHADIGWKRFTKKRKAKEMENKTVSAEEEVDIEDSDLEAEDDLDEAPQVVPDIVPTHEQRTLDAFYPPTAAHKDKEADTTPSLPEKDPLMLLRFFKSSSMSVPSCLPAQAEVRQTRPVIQHTDDLAAIRVKKRIRVATPEQSDLRRPTPVPSKPVDVRPRSVTPWQNTQSTTDSSKAFTPPPPPKAPTSIIRKPAEVAQSRKFANILSKGKSWS